MRRLATASATDIDTVWRQISAVLSDLCSVNKNLSREIQGIIGSEWRPGQVFCNLHYTLAIAQGIKSVMAKYQSKIGPEKLFPKTVGFEMDLEGQLVVMQVLDCWMRLTSVRWHVKPWNRYKQFTDFAENRGFRNVGHMIHANRFGKFEKRCAGGLYLADVWIEWLTFHTEVRNQLACYLRAVLCIMDQCKFLWAGAALIGLHVTCPYMSMLLDHKVSPRKLLTILPQLYRDLKEYPESLCQVQACAIPALKPYFLNPTVRRTSPYGVDVTRCLNDYLNDCDKQIMGIYLKTICNSLAIILKRQRGNQYGFGDDINSEELVTKNLTDELLDDEDITTTKPIENLFGNLDRELKKVGSKGFKKAADDLIIRSSKDLITPKSFQWRKKVNRIKAAELKILDMEFSNNQAELAKMNVDKSDVTLLTHQNKILQCISSCKEKHGGPLTTEEDVVTLVNKLGGDDKALNSALNLEIRLRRLTFDKVKSTCPLFRVKQLTTADKIKNLKHLISSQLEFKVMADMSDLEHAITGEEVTQGAVQSPVASTVETLSEQDMVVGEFVIGVFTDGFYPGEILEIQGDNITIDFLKPVVLKQDKEGLSLWKRPSVYSADRHTLESESILPIRPVLSITKYSNSRIVIYQLVNVDIVQKFL